jgi:hypothetical protein
MRGIVRAKRPQRLPVVLTPAEVASVLQKLKGVYWLIGCLQYGSGLRLLESLRLRVKDLDFEHRAILVRDGKGGKDRVVTLPDELMIPLRRHLASRRTLFERDYAKGLGTVFLPYALARKYPNAESEWGVAVRVRGGHGKPRSAFRETAPSPRGRKQRTESGPRRSARFRDSQAGELPFPATRRSQRTCSNAAQTYALCKSSLGTQTYERHRSIRTYSSAADWQ